MAKKIANIGIKLVKSLAGRKENHVATARSLKLRKISDVSVQPDNEATRGKIKTIAYLVETYESK